jgi:hypothetical protein
VKKSRQNFGQDRIEQCALISEVHVNEQYRGFNLYGSCEPISETLLGRVTQWKPTGCIAYKGREGAITELTRFQFPMTFDDEPVAKWFGLEIARILLDSSYRDFVIARYESQKRRVVESRLRSRPRR